jgi:GAF domain-containing protein
MENSFGIPIIPENEEERLAELYSYKITDIYEKQGSFKHIAAMAAHIFNAPVGLVSFVDREKVIIRGNFGMEGTDGVARGVSLCSLAVLRDEVTIFENALQEPCLTYNPMVRDLGLRFYAGAPLKSPEGYKIGTICIVDREPRRFSEADLALLESLASAVMNELEERKPLNNQS